MVGNTPNYTKLDILRCFLRLDKKISRKELTKQLGLGEGTVRSILDLLKDKNLLDSAKSGHFLSKEGKVLVTGIYSRVSRPVELTTNSMFPNTGKIGIHVKSTDIEKSYRLRDFAVKNGADGALMLKFDGKLYAPEDRKQDYSELVEKFKFADGDVLVVAFSSNLQKAETGALAIVVELDEGLKEFVEWF